MTTVISTSVSVWWVLMILGLPLVSALISFRFSRKSAWMAPILSTILLLATLVCTSLLFLKMREPLIYSWPWFSIDQKTLHVSFFLDNTAMMMLLAVSIVSFLVHLFSIGYMAEDHALPRYFGMLGFFTFAMMGLVVSSNLLILFCFWELVGFSSYRLINHWQEKQAAAKAATKAFMLNRIGDIGFLIGLMILWSHAGSLDISNLNITSIPTFWLSTAGICVFMGVIGKSAQFPLMSWLPDAMEGPTPVSALIHAATMVAAGVYLLIRVESLFTTDALTLISITGVITALAGAIGALFQYDIKKILAYSTISQLGFMVMAIGSGAAHGGYLHLLHHAFFKAGLFLGAGAIIHAMQHATYHQSDINVQDIRNLGGLRKKMPTTFLTFAICAAALAGIPFTAGFISKEIIFTQMSVWTGDGFSWKWIVLASAWSVAFLTPFYSFRLIWYIFFNKPTVNLEVIEVPWVMRIPLLFLSIGSLAVLFSFRPFHISSFINVLSATTVTSSFAITLWSIMVVGVSLMVAFYTYKKFPLGEPNPLLFPHTYLDRALDVIVTMAHRLSYLAHWIDRKIIDKIIHGITYLQVVVAHITGWSDRYLVDGVVNGVAFSAKGVGSLTRSIANGKIQSYLLWALAGLLIFILWILY